jgi:hypothetical protein
MNTPSHFLITAAIAKAQNRWGIHRPAFLIGSVLPDLPLWLLSIGGIAYYHIALGWSLSVTFRYLYSDLFFHNPFWIALHNCLHAPLIIGVGLIWTGFDRGRLGTIKHALFWFWAACALHTSIDILTHVTDGPVVLFPIEWSWRFQSLVSYWDDRYYGQEFQLFELTLNAGLLLYLYGGNGYRVLRQLPIQILHKIKHLMR